MEARPIVTLSKLQEQVIASLKNALKKTYGDQFKEIYLFGSVARGDAEKESDLDLLIVLRDVGDRWKERRKIGALAYEASFGENRPVVVSTIVASEKEFMSSMEPLFQRIRAEGRVVSPRKLQRSC